MRGMEEEGQGSESETGQMEIESADENDEN